MPCFCEIPASAARNRFQISAVPILPPVPLSLKLAAALPALDPENRLDLQIAAGFDPALMPNLDMGGGGLANIAMMVSLMGGNFAIDDLPQLAAQLELAAESITRNVWPRLGWLTQLKIQPLIAYSVLARLVIDLREVGLDPFEAMEPPPETYFDSYSLALTPPQLRMAQLMGGLPQILEMNAAFDLPPLGETGALDAMANHLHGLASLTPPSLAIPLPLLQKLALVLEALATIEEAFGSDAFSPNMLSRIHAMLRLWSSFRMGLPLGALRLANTLELLPSFEDFQLGQSAASSTALAGLASVSPPKLAIAPFLNVALALQGSLQVALDMEPFDMCSLCPCA
ncbi:hypothetical protein AB1M95_08095 [Sulfitobacter sp. LCG007]